MPLRYPGCVNKLKQLYPGATFNRAGSSLQRLPHFCCLWANLASRLPGKPPPHRPSYEVNPLTTPCTGTRRKHWSIYLLEGTIVPTLREKKKARQQYLHYLQGYWTTKLWCEGTIYQYMPTREVDLHRQAPSNRVRALKEGTATLRKLEIFTCKLFPTFVHIVLCKSNCCKILDV